MKTKIVRFIFALMLVLSVLGVSASTALADTPVKYDWSITVPATTNVCTFPVNVVSAYNVSEIDYFDKSGKLTMIYQHFVAQDTFNANGKTLVGLPYTANAQYFYDSSGNLTRYNAQGVLERILLPDGTLFITAGHTDALNHPGEAFIMLPDKGSQGNIAGFCAALAP